MHSLEGADDLVRKLDEFLLEIEQQKDDIMKAVERYKVDDNWACTNDCSTVYLSLGIYNVVITSQTSKQHARCDEFVKHHQNLDRNSSSLRRIVSCEAELIFYGPKEVDQEVLDAIEHIPDKMQPAHDFCHTW